VASCADTDSTLRPDANMIEQALEPACPPILQSRASSRLTLRIGGPSPGSTRATALRNAPNAIVSRSAGRIELSIVGSARTHVSAAGDCWGIYDEGEPSE